MFESGIALVRKQRVPGMDWFAPGSWLGGCPRLGGQPWPRDSEGVPTHFMAQIDLAGVATLGRTELPTVGWLSFFVGRMGDMRRPPESAVLHVTVPVPAITPPPDKPRHRLTYTHYLRACPEMS